MKLSRVQIYKTFPTGVYWEKLVAEFDLEPGDDPNEAYDAGRKLVEENHRKAYPELYVDQASEIPYINTILANDRPKSQVESMIADIKTVTDIKVLDTYLFLAKNNKNVMDAYHKKLAELQKK